MNNIVRMPQGGAPAQQGWVWDGNQWVCDPCSPGGGGGFPFCPPPGFPPPGCPPWFSGQNSPPWYPGANAGVSFGQTPPPNPVRGHFWWNGVTLFMFDGAAWVATGGAAGGGTPPSTTPPANPVPGQQWFNGATLFVWDGNAWVPVSQTKSYIQPTAPPAPNPGDTWWDGTQFRIWDGSMWELVGPGASPGPVPTTSQVLRIAQPSNVTMSGALWAIVPFTTTPSIDTMGGWDAVTHKFTAKKAGQYMFSVLGFVNGIALLRNDNGTFTSEVTDDIIAQILISGGGVCSCVGICTLNGVNDYVRVFASNTGNVFNSCGQNPVLQAWLFP